jgi:tRNA pseudouridine38-40 synthase
MQQRWKITLEYDGTPYAGWQRQDGGIRSVQSTVEGAIKAFCQQDIPIHVAGRTDAGVHARGQVAHFDLDYGDRSLTPRELAKAINAHLRDESVAVTQAAVVDPDFHARFSAVNKMYMYRILCRTAKPVLESGRLWYLRRDLDAPAMHAAAQGLLGRHDFSTFRDSQCQAKGPVKTLDRLDVTAHAYDEQGGVEVRVTVEGRSFLHHQVRTMVGTLALIGEGKWTADDLMDALAARDRTRAGINAPAEGLYLMRVDYP